MIPFVDAVAHLAGLLAGLVFAGVIGERRNRLLSGLEIVWLVACAALVLLGWFLPELFTAGFWRNVR